MLAIDPIRFPNVHGSTDTEVVFNLALTFGLEEDPIGALEQTVGFIEETGRRKGLSGLVQGTFGTSDGETLWAVRYASEGPARTLFTSADVDAVHKLYPDNARLARLGPDDRLIVSEPVADLPGVWEEIPAGTAVTVRHGGVIEHRPFVPRQPDRAEGQSAMAPAH
jgi:glutamine amidotransferase